DGVGDGHRADGTARPADGCRLPSVADQLCIGAAVRTAAALCDGEPHCRPCSRAGTDSARLHARARGRARRAAPGRPDQGGRDAGRAGRGTRAARRRRRFAPRRRSGARGRRATSTIRGILRYAMSLNSFATRQTLTVGSETVDYYSLPALEKAGFPGVSRLPFSLRILLENLLRREDDAF